MANLLLVEDDASVRRLVTLQLSLVGYDVRAAEDAAAARALLADGAPDLAILDETDSGLDVDALGVVSRGIETYKKNTGGALVVITHNTRILEHLTVDRVHVVVNGKVVAEGDASLIDQINEQGFERFESEATAE